MGSSHSYSTSIRQTHRSNTLPIEAGNKKPILSIFSIFLGIRILSKKTVTMQAIQVFSIQYNISYEALTMNDIVLSTVNLEEAIEKYIDLSKPMPDTIEPINVIRNDNGDVSQVAKRIEPSFGTPTNF